jgi:GNAT superfamily N-acetyltransferase
VNIAIAPLDPADDAAIDDMLRMLGAAVAVDVPDFPPPCRYRFVGMLRHPVPATRLLTFLVRDGDRVVGQLDVRLPMRDNTDNAEVGITVEPAYRRRGVGRALHAYLRDLLRDNGRKRAMAMTTEALPGGPERDGAGSAFATAMGATNALDEVRRRLGISTVDSDELDRLLAAAWSRADGYSLVRWRERVPEEYAADVGYLDSRLVTDSPMGDLAWEPEQIDVQRIRDGEAARVVMGIRSYSTAMVHDATGRVVALTAIGRERSAPEHAYQWITIVDPDHRGHRLGTIVKIENLRYALRHEPGVASIDTWNAATNQHMISINEALGFRPVDSWANWQQDL